MTAAHLAFVALKLIAIWTVISFTFTGLLVLLISRGKMDSHCRDDRTGGDQSVFLGCSREGGSNIDHGDRF